MHTDASRTSEGGRKERKDLKERAQGIVCDVLFAFFGGYPRPYSQKRRTRSNVHAIASTPIA